MMRFKIQYGQIYRSSQQTAIVLAGLFKIQYGQIYSTVYTARQGGIRYLKSNMDRFIVRIALPPLMRRLHLKSNMDRFIEGAVYQEIVRQNTFKIQYGQIYRLRNNKFQYSQMHLKSNMDRFIVARIAFTSGQKRILKSNMDRFIGPGRSLTPCCGRVLKSNMDRFIADVY